MEATTKVREHYWQHWLDFLLASINPHLQNVDDQEQLMVLQAFAQWAQEGAFGQGKQVKTGSIQAAIGAIYQDCQTGWESQPPAQAQNNKLSCHISTTNRSVQTGRSSN